MSARVDPALADAIASDDITADTSDAAEGAGPRTSIRVRRGRPRKAVGEAFTRAAAPPADAVEPAPRAGYAQQRKDREFMPDWALAPSLLPKAPPGGKRRTW
jgi:hypothetical protein